MPPIVDYSIYSVEDPGADLVVTPNLITVTDMRSGQDTLVYFDYGAGFFTGDLNQSFEYERKAASTFPYWIILHSMANIKDDYIGIVNAGGDFLGAMSINGSLRIVEVDSGTFYNGTTVALPIGYFYFDFDKIMIDSTFGTAYMRIYSDFEKTVLVDIAVLELHKIQDYKLHYSLQSLNIPDTSGKVSASIANHDLDTLAVIAALPKNIMKMVHNPEGIEKGVH